jgi:hypothetical protein
VDQCQPVEFYQVARGLRWKVREALGGWLDPVASRTHKKPVVEKRRNCPKSAIPGCAAA